MARWSYSRLPSVALVTRFSGVIGGLHNSCFAVLEMLLLMTFFPSALLINMLAIIAQVAERFALKLPRCHKVRSLNTRQWYQTLIICLCGFALRYDGFITGYIKRTPLAACLHLRQGTASGLASVVCSWVFPWDIYISAIRTCWPVQPSWCREQEMHILS